MAEVTWTTRARRDLDGISAFIAEGSPYYAQQTEWGIFQRSLVLADQPRIGHIVKEVGDPKVREIGFGRYRILYWLMDDDHVAIVAVIHGSRRIAGTTIRSRLRKS